MEKRRGRPKKEDSSISTNHCIIKDPQIEPFYIKKDSRNFEVIEVSISTRGFKGKTTEPKEVEKTIGYYSNFGNALNSIAKNKFYQSKGEYSTIRSYINSWKEVKQGIQTLLNEIEI
jgi:S-adenosylmethionine hydrolase